MRKLLKWIGIVLLWVAMSAVLLEGGLRLLAHRLPPRLAIGANFVLTGEQYQSDQVVSFMRTDIDHGIVLNPGLEHVQQAISPEVTIEFSTISLWGSRFGFRTRYVDYIVEMVAVGDSFTFCFTAYDDCWVRRFEIETGLGSVNLGQPGTASVSHLNMIRDYARPLAPRLVLWQFFGNDFNEDYGYGIMRGAVDADESTITLEAPPRPADSGLVTWLRHNSVAFAVLEVALGNEWPYLADYQRLFDEQYSAQVGDTVLRFGQSYELQVMDMTDERTIIGMQFTRASLEEAQRIVSEWGGTLAVIIIPTREQVYAHVTEPLMGADALDLLDGPRQAVLTMCDELALLCFDPLPLLQQRAQAGEILYYSDDLHLNAQGNAVLAEMIWRWLGGLGLLYEE